VLALIVSGARASQVVYADAYQVTQVDPIYFDNAGLTDYGLARKQFLRLNRAALDQVFDDFLSGKLRATLGAGRFY
jgi:hypothetical protein